VLQRVARNSPADLVDPSAGPIGHVVVAPHWIPHCADAPCVSYMDNERSTGKIAVCGGKVQPDCMFAPQTAIFARKHQDHLVNEVIYPANDPDELPRQRGDLSPQDPPARNVGLRVRGLTRPAKEYAPPSPARNIHPVKLINNRKLAPTRLAGRAVARAAAHLRIVVCECRPWD
jgi:hypothetical protein